MSRKKEKSQPYVYEYTKELREHEQINPLLNNPTTTDWEIARLKAEIKRVNGILRETHNPHEYKQNKAYLKRLERKLKQCQSIAKKK